MDAGGGHGRRHQVLHGVVAAQARRVLLQDMVLRQEDFQITGEEDLFLQGGAKRGKMCFKKCIFGFYSPNRDYFQLTDKRIILP